MVELDLRGGPAWLWDQQLCVWSSLEEVGSSVMGRGGCGSWCVSCTAKLLHFDMLVVC